jgi:hypothetical protein
MGQMITLSRWDWLSRKQRARMEESARRLRREGVRIITEFDEALRAQDIRDEANEWPCRWGVI